MKDINKNKEDSRKSKNNKYLDKDTIVSYIKYCLVVLIAITVLIGLTFNGTMQNIVNIISNAISSMSIMETSKNASLVGSNESAGSSTYTSVDNVMLIGFIVIALVICFVIGALEIYLIKSNILNEELNENNKKLNENNKELNKSNKKLNKNNKKLDKKY